MSDPTVVHAAHCCKHHCKYGNEDCPVVSGVVNQMRACKDLECGEIDFLLLEELEKLRRSHRDVEDCWYSCPKSEDGCCNEREIDECNCGADEHNARLDAIIAQVKRLVKA